MTTALDVSAKYSHRLAFATNDRVALLVCVLVNFESLYANTSLERWSGISQLLIHKILNIIDALEVVRPNAQGILAAGFSKEVVACILDHKPNPRIASKVDAQLHMFRFR